MKRVLFVCTGNICRSPTAEAVARYWAKNMGLDGELQFDSAGTHAYHVGEEPDPRAQDAARERGYDLSRLKARRLTAQDFASFDLILAMDYVHLDEMLHECPPQYQDKLAMFLVKAGVKHAEEVPDPYYGGPAGFEEALELCEMGVQALLDQLRSDR